MYDEADAGAAPRAIRSGTRAMADVLTRSDQAALRRRPSPDVWSVLEYGCHLRDVLLVQRERVLLALRSDASPELVPMGRDERAVHDRYNHQDNGAVARQLVEAARMLTNVFDHLTARDWDRRVVYNYPAPRERSLRWVAVHTAHEVRHHLGDVQTPRG